MPFPPLGLVRTRELGPALAAGRRLLAARTPPFHPLLLHGPPGGGKSAVAAAVAAEVPGAVNVPANDLDGPADWSHLAAAPLLVLDDLQHLPAHAADALAGLLDARRRHRKGTIGTANTGPAGLPFDRRLASRLAEGLVVRVPLPGPKSRRKLIEALPGGELLTPAAQAWVAREFPGGVRIVQGVLRTLATAAAGRSVALTKPEVASLLAAERTKIGGDDLTRLTRKVAQTFGFAPTELAGPSRLPQVVRARQLAIYLGREALKESLPRLGKAFRRDHKTVLYAVRKVAADRETDPELAARIEALWPQN
jgi:chromosomal replication initiator protein